MCVTTDKTSRADYMYEYKQWASIVGILASLSRKLSMNISRSSTNQ